MLRPRLLRTMASRWDLRLVTVEAGAGVGKTTLLADAIRENAIDPRGRDVWLSLEAADSSTTVLAGALLHAMGRTADPRRHPSMTDVCEAIWDETPTQICLVLDDAHHLEAVSSGASALETLLAELPANGHLVVACRALPHLPRARLLAQGLVAEIREADLRFDDRELAAFAQQRGVPSAALAGAAGWPALAELRVGFGTSANRDVPWEAYLWEEVLAPLTASDRLAFLRIAAIGGGDRAIVEVAAGTAANLDHLAALPLCASDGTGGLRPHALWGDVALGRLDRDDIADCRRRVATTLRERGQFGAAFELLARAKDWDAALDALFDACNDQREPPWPDVVTRWRTLVDPGLHDRAEVAYLDAYLARSADPWSDAAWEAFHRAVDGFRANGDRRRATVAEVRMIWSAWLRGDAEAIRRIDRRLYPDLLGRPGEGLRSNLAVLADLEGDTASLREHAIRLAGSALEPRLSHFAGIHRVQADLVDGCADGETTRFAQRAADAGRAIEPAAASGWAILAPPIVAWARGRLDDAMSFGIDEIDQRFSIAERVPALAFGAVRAAHLGRLDEADVHIVEIRRVTLPGAGRDLLAGMLAVAEATALAARGDEPAAAASFAANLGDRALLPSGAGKAVHWFPGVAYLLNVRCRELLDDAANDTTRREVLDVVRALASWRTGAHDPHPRTLALLDQPRALLTALPLAQCVELAVRAHERRDGRAAKTLAELSVVAPIVVRDALQRLMLPAQPAGVRKATLSVTADVAIPPTYDVRIDVFGPTRVQRGGVPAQDPDLGRERVRQLLLALVAFREIRRNRLGAMLWPEFDEGGVSANLRMTLSYVQGILEPDRVKGAAAWFLRQDAGVLRLEGGYQLRVDAWDAEALLDDAERARADATPSVELSLLLEVIGMWRGDYLEDVAGEDWAQPLRERVTARLVSAGVRAGDLLVAAGRAEEAIEVAERVLRAEPWAEAAYRVAIRARLARHDRSGALRTLAACRRMCADLGVEPETATLDLARAAAQGR